MSYHTRLWVSSVLSPPISSLTPMLQSPLEGPCSYLRVLAQFSFVPLPRKPLTSNCMSSYFSVQRALTIGHSGLPFHFVFFPALPWLHFKLSIHQSIYSFTHLSTYPLTYTPCECTGTGLRTTTVWSRAEWRLVRCSGTLEFCQLVGKAKPTPPTNLTKIKFISQQIVHQKISQHSLKKNNIQDLNSIAFRMFEIQSKFLDIQIIRKKGLFHNQEQKNQCKQTQEKYVELADKNIKLLL